ARDLATERRPAGGIVVRRERLQPRPRPEPVSHGPAQIGQRERRRLDASATEVVRKGTAPLAAAQRERRGGRGGHSSEETTPRELARRARRGGARRAGGRRGTAQDERALSHVPGGQPADGELLVRRAHRLARDAERDRRLARRRQPGAPGEAAAGDQRRDVVGQLPGHGYLAGAIGPERDLEHDASVVESNWHGKWHHGANP